MNISNRFQLILILFMISVFPLIENKPNNLTALPPLCYETTERLVRTPYGFRCVVTKRSTEKRSTEERDLSSQETDLSDINPDINKNNNNNNNRDDLIKDEDLNSVIPVVEPTTLSAKYRKIVIKNNRGPWKIANMLFKRSPMSGTTPTSRSSGDEQFTESMASKMDGLLVSRSLANDNVTVLSAKSGLFGRKAAETVVPMMSDTSIEDKFIKNLPKINLFTKTVDKKNLRNFKFSSDIDVIDLMEEDSIPRSHSFSDNKTFVVNVLSTDRRMTRSPKPTDKSLSTETTEQSRSDERTDNSFTPIRIFVFLNRNRNKDKGYRTESSNRFTIAETPQRKTLAELKSDSSVAILRRTTSTTTTTTTTPKTTTTKMTTTSKPIIKRILKKLDLNEFDDKIGTEWSDIDEAKEREEQERYLEPTEPSIEEYFSLTTAIPVSRNWGFVCGKRKGFFADVDNDCRTYYQCSVRGRQRWECPPGTRFNQFSSTCDWIDNVDCLSFKDIINGNKSGEEHNSDSTTATSPLAWSFSTASTTTTPGYETDYEDPFEE